jgi:hypothetical protein
MRRIARLGWTWLQREIDATVMVLLVGLGLMAYGCWLSWRPGAFLLPGLVLVWLSLPSRAPFVASSAPPAPRRS